jgi:hypothetical protein
VFELWSDSPVTLIIFSVLFEATFVIMCLNFGQIYPVTLIIFSVLFGATFVIMCLNFGQISPVTLIIFYMRRVWKPSP